MIDRTDLVTSYLWQTKEINPVDCVEGKIAKVIISSEL